MSNTIKVTLSDPILAQLQQLADGAGEAPATLAAQMIRHCIAQAAHDGKLPTSPPPSTAVQPRSSDRPPWLEPYGGSDDWRSEMWGQIVGLHARYPQELAHLKDGWWLREAQVEILCALAAWRAELDEHASDPRDELTFHAQLADYGEMLRKEGGGITKAWKPGAPPPEWIAG